MLLFLVQHFTSPWAKCIHSDGWCTQILDTEKFCNTKILCIYNPIYTNSMSFLLSLFTVTSLFLIKTGGSRNFWSLLFNPHHYKLSTSFLILWFSPENYIIRHQLQCTTLHVWMMMEPFGTHHTKTKVKWFRSVTPNFWVTFSTNWF